MHLLNSPVATAIKYVISRDIQKIEKPMILWKFEIWLILKEE